MRLTEITNTKKFIITSQSDFERGFQIRLVDQGQELGHYSYWVDDEGLSRHSISVEATA